MSLLISKVFTYDTDAGNYIQAVEAADGQVLEGATRQAINNFVMGCKQDGTWTAIKRSCILAGARTLNGALVPFIGTAPTNYNFVSGDYNRKTGLVGNGSNKYLDTNYKISDRTSGLNLHLGLSATSNLQSGRPLGVFRQAAYNRHYLPVDGAGVSGWGSQTYVTTPSTGHIISSRLSTGSATRYLNGTFNTTLDSDNSQPSDWSVTVFISHGSPAGYSNETEQFNGASAARINFYHVGDGLTASQAATLSANFTTMINAFAAAIP